MARDRPLKQKAGMETPMKTGALSGISVLELGSMVAAPYCAKLLADLGADVVKVEAPGLGDPARRRGPFPDDVPHLERSALFLYLNTSKRGVTLDLGSETGRRIFRDLARDVDSGGAFDAFQPWRRVDFHDLRPLHAFEHVDAGNPEAHDLGRP